MFEQFAPLSWVLAGFAGLVAAVAVFALFSGAYSRWVRARYDRGLYERSGFVDPMAKTFENKRIFLTEFCLPSDSYIAGKAFTNCELIGPANIFLRVGNFVADQKLPLCDTVIIVDKTPFNAVIFDNCSFRDCSFKRITILLSSEEYINFKHLNWLNWITLASEEPMLPGISRPTQPEAIAPPQPSEHTGDETRQ